jgi:hypothetical protein
MASVSIVKIKLRRGTDAERQQIVLDNGELGYVTDINGRRIFVGDGVSPGGFPVGTKYFTVDLSSPTTYSYAQIGDLVYDDGTSFLYSVTAIDTTTAPYNYFFKRLSSKVDDTTIEYSLLGALRLKTGSVSETYIKSTSFTNGITGGSGTKIGVNYDNNKITYSDGKLTVNENGLSLSSIPAFLPTSNPGPGKLWVNMGVINIGT